jgi:hypothetical protein
MLARHLALHVGLAAAAVMLLPVLFGVAWSTALLVGMMAGCAAMAFGIGHGSHQHDTTTPTRTDMSQTKE